MTKINDPIATADLNRAPRHLTVMGQSDAVLWRIPTASGELRSIEWHGRVSMSLAGAPVDPWRRADRFLIDGLPPRLRGGDHV